MSKYQVMQDEYHAVVEYNPSYFTTGVASGEMQGKRPVENVTWYDAAEFCNKLSLNDGYQPVYTMNARTPANGYPITSATISVDWNKNGYRLPTEAEWEYACRAGTTTTYNTGSSINDNTGWYNANSSGKTHEVGKKPANAFGLFGMHGNVKEWCWDWHGTYSNGTVTDPKGPETGTYRMSRGGGYVHAAQSLRSAYRYTSTDYVPSYRSRSDGFRVVRVP